MCRGQLCPDGDRNTLTPVSASSQACSRTCEIMYASQKKERSCHHGTMTYSRIVGHVVGHAVNVLLSPNYIFKNNQNYYFISRIKCFSV